MDDQHFKACEEAFNKAREQTETTAAPKRQPFALRYPDMALDMAAQMPRQMAAQMERAAPRLGLNWITGKRGSVDKGVKLAEGADKPTEEGTGPPLPQP